MSYEIQAGIHCENCIKCGSKPVVDQVKKGWEVKCPNAACKNAVTGPTINFDAWNNVNKIDVNINNKKNLARSA